METASLSGKGSTFLGGTQSARRIARVASCRASRVSAAARRTPGVAKMEPAKAVATPTGSASNGSAVDPTFSSAKVAEIEQKAADIHLSEEWKALAAHVADIDKTHLKDLLLDENRCDTLTAEHNKVFLDYSRQRVQPETLKLLVKLAERAQLKEKIDAMFNGEVMNATEDRPVLHVACRAPRNEVVTVDGKNVVPDVWEVLDQIKAFSEKVRNGEWLGITGKPLTNVVAIGIGGSFLGPLFVHTALRTNQEASETSRGRQLRFLANVDPIDVARSLNGLDAEETLVVVISKTFTTAETMLNARTVRSWLINELGAAAIPKHMVAVSTNLKLVKEFGIDPANAFGFWDWVGGRYSVTSAVGVLPLALQYGFDVAEHFLKGAWDMDTHYRTAPLEQNVPALMGMLQVWNTSFLNYSSLAILPYCQALAKLPAHIQQVSMESNGKAVTIEGKAVPYKTGEIDFGEPGTNGQHSFYQLIHQGRVVPCEFIGIVKSQQSVYLTGEVVSNHDELMCNYFAQADALAVGKDPITLRAENVPDHLIPHKTFTGNRPSLSLLLPQLDAFTCGQLLSIYEHKVATAGFLWGLNSFDQWGVELGKVLASRVRTTVNQCRTKGRYVNSTDGYNPSTTKLLNRYLEGKHELKYDKPKDVFPSSLIHETSPQSSYPDK
jgi:glucose-6-phosphate isomerase